MPSLPQREGRTGSFCFVVAIVYHTRADLSTVFLFFHGDRAALAPAGVEIGLVHRLIGTHPHIVFLALGELGNGLGGGLGALYSHGLVALFEVLVRAVLHLVAGGLGGLLLPSHFQLGFFGAGHLAHRSALGIDGKGALFRAGIMILKLDGRGVFAYILGALGVSHGVLALGDRITQPIRNRNARFFLFAVISVGSLFSSTIS